MEKDREGKKVKKKAIKEKTWNFSIDLIDMKMIIILFNKTFTLSYLGAECKISQLYISKVNVKDLFFSLNFVFDLVLNEIF